MKDHSPTRIILLACLAIAFAAAIASIFVSHVSPSEKMAGVAVAFTAVAVIGGMVAYG